MNKINFPENFYWGSSVSSHQVEGGNHNDWSEWETESSKLKVQNAKSKNWPDYILAGYPNPLNEENYISGRACDHYNRFEEDFDIAKSLNHSAHRFSIEWSRVEPKEGKFDEREIEHYKKVINTLKSRGLEPFISLWHWTNPVWIKEKKGWKNNEIIKYFNRYVEKIVSEFQGEIKFWITLNEPEIFASQSYLRGIWPPQEKSIIHYLETINNLIKAHREAYKIIKKHNLSAQVGIAKNNVYFEAQEDNFLSVTLKKGADWWWNSYFLNQIENYQDFVGLNHYFHNKIKNGKFNQNENKIISDMGWEVYPQSIYYVLKDLQKYNKPIYITENGIADSRDKLRADFIKEYLFWVYRAIKEGVDVRGYFYWSLLDNFEWDKGFWSRFGLVEIDYKTMERKIRPSAKIYAEICKNNYFEI